MTTIGKWLGFQMTTKYFANFFLTKQKITKSIVQKSGQPLCVQKNSL